MGTADLTLLLTYTEATKLCAFAVRRQARSYSDDDSFATIPDGASRYATTALTRSGTLFILSDVPEGHTFREIGLISEVPTNEASATGYTAHI